MWIFFDTPVNADGLQINFTSPTDPSVIVGSSLSHVNFDGFIINNSQSPITFSLITPSPKSSFVASVMSSVPFTGTTLGADDKTALQTLVKVALNLLDPSLQYPGVASILLEVETLQGNIIAESNLTVPVLSSAVREVPSPSSLSLTCTGLLVWGVAGKSAHL